MPHSAALDKFQTPEKNHKVVARFGAPAAKLENQRTDDYFAGILKG